MNPKDREKIISRGLKLSKLGFVVIKAQFYSNSKAK